MKKLNILWHGVAPFIYSGYGNLTKNIALRIGQLYPTVVSCYYGLHLGGSLRIAGVRILPTSEYNWGEKEVKCYLKKFHIDLPILASDFWPFKWFAQLPSSMFYGPIDSSDYIEEDIETMKRFSYFIPCSRFGARVYKRLTKRAPVEVIPHGVDTKIFRPYPKEECRRIFCLPRKKFIIGIVAANSDPEPRKGWDDLFIALSEFLKRNPIEKRKLLIFAFTRPSDERGYSLQNLVKKLGLTKNILFPEYLPQIVGLPEQEMAKLYSCFDLLLNASRREGFCLPILEAQSCGVPVIASNTTAIPELVKGHGWLVKMKDLVFAPRGWKCRKVDREDLVEKLEDAYFSASKRREFSFKARKFALKYDWELLFKSKWVPLLENLSSKDLNKIASS